MLCALSLGFHGTHRVPGPGHAPKRRRSRSCRLRRQGVSFNDFNVALFFCFNILWNQHLRNMSQPSAKKKWIISVNCRRPARNLWTLGRPDHGPKNGATNLEASLGPESGPILGAAKHTRELLHRAPYRQQGEIRWYMCCRQCGLAIHDAVHYTYTYTYIIYIYTVYIIC